MVAPSRNKLTSGSESELASNIFLALSSRLCPLIKFAFDCCVCVGCVVVVEEEVRPLFNGKLLNRPLVLELPEAIPLLGTKPEGVLLSCSLRKVNKH